MGIKTALFVIFLSVGNLLACYPDENMLVCWDLQEGSGVNITDSSGRGMQGTLTGAVAWVPAPKPRAIYTTNSATNTFANMGEQAVSFPGTDEVNVRSALTSVFDFSPSLPFITGLTFQLQSKADAIHKELIGSCDMAIGWLLYIDGSDELTFWPLGSGTVSLASIQDTNPHRVLVGRAASGLTMMALDGKVLKTTTSSNMITTLGATYLAVGSNPNVQSPFNGKANRAVVYAKDFTPDSFAAFAKNEYLYWQGIDFVDSETGQ